MSAIYRCCVHVTGGGGGNLVTDLIYLRKYLFEDSTVYITSIYSNEIRVGLCCSSYTDLLNQFNIKFIFVAYPLYCLSDIWMKLVACLDLYLIRSKVRFCQ